MAFRRRRPARNKEGAGTGGVSESDEGLLSDADSSSSEDSHDANIIRWSSQTGSGIAGDAVFSVRLGIWRSRNTADDALLTCPTFQVINPAHPKCRAAPQDLL